jgi:hypothetical protein
MVTHGFRNQTIAPAKNYNCNANPIARREIGQGGAGVPARLSQVSNETHSCPSEIAV